MKKNLGLYIHIPFCQKKCDYCDFVSFCKTDDIKIEYVSCLIKEISMQGIKFKDYDVDTIYIGGGTPSCLPNGAIYKILNSVYQNFNVLKGAEITIESNPNSLDFAKLQEYRYAKINRLSIGLQCYNDKLLKLIGRLHTKKQFDDAYRRARLVGFRNINVDLILGVPKQRLLDVKHELHHLTRLGVDHISAYGLIVEEGTKLAQNLKGNVYNLPAEKLQLKMYDTTKKYLQKKGYFRYEVSNFAKSGFECKHNLKYWKRDEYLGLGLVSSSLINESRFKNTDNLEKYLSSIKLGKIETEQNKQIDKDKQIEETIMLSLRRNSGIDIIDFEKQFGYSLLKDKKAEIDELISQKLIEINDNQLYCTDRGFEVLNQIILKLA